MRPTRNGVALRALIGTAESGHNPDDEAWSGTGNGEPLQAHPVPVEAPEVEPIEVPPSPLLLP